MTESKQVRAIISGKVQGVWYRAWTEEQANSLGLEGWVRNRSDGAVEAVFSGAAEKVDEMLRRCAEGPPMARVRKVSVEPDRSDLSEGFRQASDV